MRFRRTLTFLMLVMALVFAQSAGARQKPAAPVSRSRHPSKLRFANTRGAALKDGATTPGTSSAKPFKQEQVQGMLRDGFGDESDAKPIEQRGIDFAPSEQVARTCYSRSALSALNTRLHIKGGGTRSVRSPHPRCCSSALTPAYSGRLDPFRHRRRPWGAGLRYGFFANPRRTGFEPSPR